MKSVYLQLTAAFLATSLVGGPSAFAQQAPAAPTVADLPRPSAEVTPYPAYIETVARSAYVWGWPMVNMLNRRATITQAPEPGLLNGVLPVAPLSQLAMLSDYIDPGRDLRDLPEPGRGLRRWASSRSTRSRWSRRCPTSATGSGSTRSTTRAPTSSAQLGKPYGTKPGFYLLVGPKWQGEVPAGHQRRHQSTTALANRHSARLHGRHRRGSGGHPAAASIRSCSIRCPSSTGR